TAGWTQAKGVSATSRTAERRMCVMLPAPGSRRVDLPRGPANNTRVTVSVAASGPDPYVAPFAPGGSLAIDAALADRLLGEALARGGEYAELYFEYRASGDYVLEEQRIRNV